MRTVNEAIRTTITLLEALCMHCKQVMQHNIGEAITCCGMAARSSKIKRPSALLRARPPAGTQTYTQDERLRCTSVGLYDAAVPQLATERLNKGVHRMPQRHHPGAFPLNGRDTLVGDAAWDDVFKG